MLIYLVIIAEEPAQPSSTWSWHGSCPNAAWHQQSQCRHEQGWTHHL